jgi:hypothetical protein
MRLVIVALSLSLASAWGFQAKKCDDLKSEIAAKLDAKGAKGYTLDVVAAGDVKDQTVVGSCEAGSKKITYTKGGAAPAKSDAGAKPSPAPKGK